MKNILALVGRYLAGMRSENWGGVCGLIGDLTILLAGDVQSLSATASFMLGEYSLFRHGHKSAGYSAGYGLLALGDVFVCFSRATEDNFPLKLSMAGLALLLAMGALRYPLEKLAGHGGKEGLRKIADRIPPTIGCLLMIQHIPVLATAGLGGNYLMFFVQSLWATQDALTGRLQEYTARPLRAVRSIFCRNV